MHLKSCVLSVLGLLSGLALAANGPTRAPQGASSGTPVLLSPPPPPDLPVGEYFERTEMTVDPNGRKVLKRYDSQNPQGRILTKAEGEACAGPAVRVLREFAPRGARVYDLLKNKDAFVFFIKCKRWDLLPSLPSAVHESVHALTTQYDAYYLLNGTILKAVQDDAGFMRPSEIASLLDPGDDKVQHYITGDPNGSSGAFWILLDEFNAYTHSLDMTLQLPLHSQVRYERYSLLSMMKFVKLYAEVARERNSATYRALFQRDRRFAIQTLWTQAQRLLDISCRHTPRDSREPLFTDVYRKSDARRLAEVLDGYPAMPSACR